MMYTYHAFGHAIKIEKVNIILSSITLGIYSNIDIIIHHTSYMIVMMHIRKKLCNNVCPEVKTGEVTRDTGKIQPKLFG